MMYYKLDQQGNAVRADGLADMEECFNSMERIVAKDNVGDSEVSTVFLCIDQNYSGDGVPVLWETMIFGGKHDQYQRRYTSKEEAVKVHNSLVQLLQQEESKC